MTYNSWNISHPSFYWLKGPSSFYRISLFRMTWRIRAKRLYLSHFFKLAPKKCFRHFCLSVWYPDWRGFRFDNSISQNKQKSSIGLTEKLPQKQATRPPFLARIIKWSMSSKGSLPSARQWHPRSSQSVSHRSRVAKPSKLGGELLLAELICKGKKTTKSCKKQSPYLVWHLK